MHCISSKDNGSLLIPEVEKKRNEKRPAWKNGEFGEDKEEKMTMQKKTNGGKRKDESQRVSKKYR